MKIVHKRDDIYFVECGWNNLFNATEKYRFNSSKGYWFVHRQYFFDNLIDWWTRNMGFESINDTTSLEELNKAFQIAKLKYDREKKLERICFSK